MFDEALAYLKGGEWGIFKATFRVRERTKVRNNASNR